ncbi:diguanylate cyclase [Calothrix sp. PCC 6303]|uniref:diguanylate cyclase n=1 Tax=Calothrix sp. PCC 6303 TaxID=1170562 RepID=UPI0002A0134A|nr:diguanylate cyclase [Calothrix sp. PCC 6303]AFY99951.1 diguanylate cyclase [Calothrix sp. PCC 6303]
MNISILIYGSDRFFATLPDQIRNANALNDIEIVDNLNQAISRIQITPPDLIIIQASLEGSLDLCFSIREQAKLSSIYSILIEDRPQMLADRSQQNRNWDLEMTTAALGQGADAYIWWFSPEDEHQTQLTTVHNLLLTQLAVGLRKAQKYRDLMRTNDLLSAIALSDSLTELKNRRALEWELPQQIHKARTQGLPMSLLILDVDFFKKVNDTYGHLVGDRLLHLLCTRLRHNLRFQDTPFRYGGEEFVIILGDTSLEEAMLVARRLNNLISEQPFTINNELSIKVTISLGVACLESDDDAKGTSLLYRADKYLLQAKASGRDRVVGCDGHFTQTSHLRVVSS